MGQDIFDLIIVVTLVLFIMRGIGNGLVGEVAGVFSLVGGFWAARAWHAAVAPHLEFIADPSLRVIAACVLVFVAVMLAIGILARILKKIIAFSFVGWIDKLAGAFFGLAKGVLIWALLLLIMEKFFHDAPFMRDSRALPYFHAIVEQLKQWLPPDLSARIGI